MGKHGAGQLYRDIPILDAARRCGLVLNDRTLEWEEVEASCPFCGDNGPGKYHLFLNTTKNVYRCVLCEEKGNSVSLYAKMEGVSNRQAFEALSEKGRLYRFPQRSLSKKPAERSPSVLPVRHDTYYDMLMHLELSPKHKADLLARGLSEERIERNMYRSLPQSRSARRLLAGILSDFHDLEGIPGFYVNKGYWDISGHTGLLVPYCDKDGYIQGMQIRLDDECDPDRKYRWLSSRGMAHGTRSHAHIHVTGDTHAKTAYLTEGGLKGDVASFLDDDALFICFAGVNAISDLEGTLRDLPNVEETVIALDMDKLMNWRVRKALDRLTALVKSLGLRVRLMNWNVSFKGVDDFYQARNHAAAQGVNILDMTSNFITVRLNDLWRSEYPKQDRGFIHTCEWEELTVPMSELEADAPADMDKAWRYLQLMQEGHTEFPPLVCVNGTVIDGLHRFWAYQQMGYQQVTIYQNKPWAMPAAA
jgi:DNA primase